MIDMTSTAQRSACTATIQPLTIATGLAIALIGQFTAIAADDAIVHERLGPEPAALEQSVGRAIGYLQQAQADDGSFSPHVGPAVTAIATTALLRHGRSPDDPLVARSLNYIEQFVHDDGGIYQPGSRYKNYETSLAILCYHEANRDGRYDELLRRAELFGKKIQWDEDEGHDLPSPSYGGAGYGRHSRPDLSNTAFLIDALQTLGRDENDPALQKALVFVSRCQNLETEHNTTEFAAKIDDGGFYYTAAAGGTSQAGQTPDGGLRSYGSMTYAGLKSMIYCGVGPDDPRVQAAYRWIQSHYTLTENPGMGADGYFYYLHTFAKALDAIGEDQLADAEGVAHDWRRELAEQLFSLQKDDGSWVGESERWLEADPNLVTAYALLSLSYCKPQAGDRP